MGAFSIFHKKCPIQWNPSIEWDTHVCNQNNSVTGDPIAIGECSLESATSTLQFASTNMRASCFCVDSAIDERNLCKNAVFWRKMAIIGLCDQIFLRCCRTLKFTRGCRLHPEVPFEYAEKFVPFTEISLDHKTCLSRIGPLNGTLFW